MTPGDTPVGGGREIPGLDDLLGAWRGGQPAQPTLLDALLARADLEPVLMGAQRGQGHRFVVWLCGQLCARLASADAAGRLAAASFSLKAYDTTENASRRLPDDDPRRHYWLGNLARMAQRADEAAGHFERALQLAPWMKEAAVSYAYLLQQQGRPARAADLLRRTGPHLQDRDDRLAVAALLRDLQAPEAALELLDDDIRDADGLWLRARLLQSLGQFDDALTAVRRVLDQIPSHPGALLALSHLQRFRQSDHADMQRLRDCYQASPGYRQLADDSRIALDFALGKAWDDVGDYARAHHHYTAGNQGQSRRQPWDAGAWTRAVDNTLAMFEPPVPGGASQPSPQWPRPLFIVGTLRSGTTLVEQRLAADPALSARGELPYLPRLLEQAFGRHWAQGLIQSRASDRHRLREYYLRHAARGDQQCRYWIDKNPLNFRYLGAIAWLFPEARVIHCRRDPRDALLSCYFQLFQHRDAAFSYRLEDLIRFYADYRRLMAFWQSVPAMDVHTIRYENMIEHNQEVMARARTYLALPAPVADSGSGSEPQTVVRTASVWQARQGLYRRSLQRWRRYQSMMPEFFEALEQLDRQYQDKASEPSGRTIN